MSKHVMRRQDRQVADREEVARILDQSTVVFVAFRDEPFPYVVPLFFGHEPGRLYVHSAAAGTKIELLRADPHVGFSAVAKADIVEGEDACAFTARAESVVGTGMARIVDTEEERLRGLRLIMRHYAGSERAGGLAFKSAALSRTAVIAIDVEQMQGKRI